MTSLGQLSRFRFPGKSEQAVREEWIAPLLVHLGYGGETLHEVRYEQPLRLAKPFRRIGRARVAVDYSPTVYGRGLWIIEAKAAESEDWEDALIQAWLYATHPEVDAPFMAIADGTRFAVYDTQRVDWDVPEVDVAVADLERRFGELRQVLGAATITRAVRERRLRHLGAAMHAEVDVRRLDEYVDGVRKLADQARPTVNENYRAILRDQFATDEQREREALAEAGLFAIGVWANRPFGMSKRMLGMARDILLEAPPEERRARYARLLDAARRRRSEPPRQFTNLRLARLFVALSCMEHEGCAFMRADAATMLRQHLLNFPDDELDRAAHRLERVLPVFFGRLARARGDAPLTGLARQLQDHLSDEMRVRSRLDADHLFVEFVRIHTERLWHSLPWETDAVSNMAEQLEDSLDAIEVQSTQISGLAGDPHFEWHYRRDQLELGTLYEMGALIGAELLDEELVARLREIVAGDDDETRMVAPARRLIAAYEDARAGA